MQFLNKGPKDVLTIMRLWTLVLLFEETQGNSFYEALRSHGWEHRPVSWAGVRMLLCAINLAGVTRECRCRSLALDRSSSFPRIFRRGQQAAPRSPDTRLLCLTTANSEVQIPGRPLCLHLSALHWLPRSSGDQTRATAAGTRSWLELQMSPHTKRSGIQYALIYSSPLT